MNTNNNLWAVYVDGRLDGAVTTKLLKDLYGTYPLTHEVWAVRERKRATVKTFPFAVLDPRVGLTLTAAEAGPVLNRLPHR